MADFLTAPFLKIGPASMPDEGWSIQSTTWTQAGDVGEAYRSLPYLFRAVDIRSHAVASMPFTIYRGDAEATSSDAYEDVLGTLPHPGRLLGIIEAALCVWGYSYIYAEPGRELRYLLPESVKPVLDSATGLTGFTRAVGSRRVPLPMDQVLYFWRPDPFVEIGPPTTSPVRSALASANVLLNIDKFAAAFFARGAIKTTLLTVSGSTSSEERNRLEEWWKRVADGIKNAFAAKVVNADAVKPVVVGEGLESLSARNPLTDVEKKAVATGMGIPYSLLFSDAANYATAKQDNQHFYSKTINPECGFIAEVFNEQYLAPLGYRLAFNPENLEVFQEDEVDRAAALSAVTAALKDPLAEVAMSILGYDVSEEDMARLRAYWGQSPATITVLPVAEAASELRAWQRKAVKRVGQGRPVPFESRALSPALAGAIAGGLEVAASAEDVHRVFESVWRGYP